MPRKNTRPTSVNPSSSSSTVKSDHSNESTKSYAKRKIINNWDKYDKEIEPLDDTQINRDSNFTQLSKKCSDGTHFQLASEKQWESAETQTDSLFTLDLKLLSLGLSCVPFYERIGIDKSKLMPSTVERFDRDASAALKAYGQRDMSCSLSENSFNVEAVGVKTTEKDLESVEGNVKFLEEDDLEDWLDGVLDK